MEHIIGKWYKKPGTERPILKYNGGENTVGYWINTWGNDWGFHRGSLQEFTQEATYEDLIKLGTEFIPYWEGNKYSAQDWIDGKILIQWEYDKADEIIKFFEDLVKKPGHYKHFTYCSNTDTFFWDGLIARVGHGRTDLPILKINELINMKKIIGYRAPQNLGGYNNKGKIFKIAQADTGKWYEWKEDINCMRMPSEIAETWEPVYEEEYKTVVVGSNNTEVNIYPNGTIKFRNNESTITKVRALRDSYLKYGVFIGKWEVKTDLTIRFILIGCLQEQNLFSINDLSLVINTYENFHNN